MLLKIFGVYIESNKTRRMDNTIVVSVIHSSFNITILLVSKVVRYTTTSGIPLLQHQQ